MKNGELDLIVPRLRAPLLSNTETIKWRTVYGLLTDTYHRKNIMVKGLSIPIVRNNRVVKGLSIPIFRSNRFDERSIDTYFSKQ